MATFDVDGELCASSHDEPTIELWYPRVQGNASHIQVGLSDVRAADNIRIHYDFDRDGWVIEQAAVFEWPAGEKEFDPDWAEVAFIQAWGRQRIPPLDQP